MRDRVKPTHVLRIDVPLDLSDPPHDYDAVKDALRIVLSTSRAGFDGHICDDPQVTSIENPPTWPLHAAGNPAARSPGRTLDGGKPRPQEPTPHKPNPRRMRALKIGALVVPYLVAVVAANLLVNHFGPSSAPYIAFGLIGAVLIFRDRFADLVGPRRVIAQTALIVTGAVLTWLVNRHAATIAEASVVAFAASEAIEGTLYFAIRYRPWLERAPLSATAGAAVDSVLFITIAFGFSFPIAFGQFVAKVAGAYLWARLIQATRREVLPRHP